jgi:hypothetical protein
MSFLYDQWLRLFSWLTKDSAAHSTALLVLITAWYAVLTSRMSRAMERQTRALVQPVLHLKVCTQKDDPYPKGSFTISNVGTQPAMLLDIELFCRYNGKSETENYSLWDQHILSPGRELEPLFDFTDHFTKRGTTLWSPGWVSYQLKVTASDLSKTVALTYRNLPVLAVTNMDSGIPLLVRWRYFKRSARWKWQAFKRSVSNPFKR